MGIKSTTSKIVLLANEELNHRTIMKVISACILAAATAVMGQHTVNCADWLASLDSEEDLVADTRWKLKSNTVVSYPCSTGYLKNALANPNLQKDIFSRIDDLAGAQCAQYCNLDNASYASVGDAVGLRDITPLLGGDVCTALGQPGAGFGFAEAEEDANACKCAFKKKKNALVDSGVANTSVAGCRVCSGQVSFKIVNCLDIDVEVF